MILKKLIIAILLLVPFTGFAKFGYERKDLAFYYGQSYRFNDRFSHVLDISYEHYKTSCLRATFKGAGLRLDYFSDSNYSFAPKIFKSFQRRPSDNALLYYGIAPVLFRFEGDYGLNVKPDVGARLYYPATGLIGFSFNVSYGYEIPVVSETAFTAGRHDLSARVAVCLDLARMQSWFKKPTEEKQNEQQ